MLPIIGVIFLFLEVLGYEYVADLGRYGKVVGKNLERNGVQIVGYLGIPYAQPPIGNLRFRPPQPMPNLPGNGTYLAVNYGYPCVTYDNLISDQERDGTNTYAAHGDENCLYLNIYTPKTGGPYQVWVIFHDGAFSFGVNYDNSHFYMMKSRPVVIVQVAYRLGPFGFLSTGDKECPGNMGLKDQVMALKWIKRHIVHFRGQPHHITIGGAGAGAASAHYHVLSPASRALFNTAYCASGNALMPQFLMNDLPQKTKTLAAMFDCPTSPSAALVDCLRRLPPLALAGAMAKFKVFMYSPTTIFGPTVEAPGSEDIFLAKHPIDIYKERQFNDVPLLLSATSQGGLYNVAEYLGRPKLLKLLDENWEKYMPHIMFYNSTIPAAEQPQIARQLRNVFMGNKTLNMETRWIFLQMVTDRLFLVPTFETAKLHALHSQKGVFLYRFSYSGPTSTSTKITSDKLIGVSAGDDFNYVFPSIPIFEKASFADDLEMPKRMMDLVQSFGDYGFPPQEMFWPLFAPDDGPYMEISTPRFLAATTKLPFAPSRDTFMEIFKTEYKNKLI